MQNNAEFSFYEAPPDWRPRRGGPPQMFPNKLIAGDGTDIPIENFKIFDLSRAGGCGE